MLKIQKNNDIKIVTKGAFDNFYESMGYRIVTNKKEKEFKDVIVTEKKFNDEKQNDDKQDNKNNFKK